MHTKNDALHSLVFELYCEVGGAPTHFSDWLNAHFKI